MPSHGLREYVTTRQAAVMLGVLTSSVNHPLHGGRLEGVKLGRDWFVYTPSIEDYLNKSPNCFLASFV